MANKKNGVDKKKVVEEEERESGSSGSEAEDDTVDKKDDKKSATGKKEARKVDDDSSVNSGDDEEASPVDNGSKKVKVDEEKSGESSPEPEAKTLKRGRPKKATKKPEVKKPKSSNFIYKDAGESSDPDVSEPDSDEYVPESGKGSKKVRAPRKGERSSARSAKGKKDKQGKKATRGSGKTKDSEDEEEGSSSESEDEEYSVQEILDKRVTKKGTEYFLKWNNFDDSHNSWEPKQNLYCLDLIKEFEASYDKPSKGRGRPSSSPAKKGKVTPKSAAKGKKRGAKPKSSPAKKAKRGNDSSDEEDYDSDNPPSVSGNSKKTAKAKSSSEDNEPKPYKCLHCSVGFDVKKGGKKSNKKWSLASQLNVDVPLSVYEGLSIFYTHYKGEYPLAKLEPIASVQKEERLLCQSCGTTLSRFCAQLQSFTQASDKTSALSVIAGDLEAEKEDWQGELEGKNGTQTSEERAELRRSSGKVVSYKEVEENDD